MGAPGSRPVEPLAVDLSINEPICANQSLVVGDGRRCLWVSTSEDIVDGKLQTFMQQKETIRNRERPQAFWDRVSLGDVSRFLPILLRETKAGNVPLSKATFKDPDLAERASYDSEELRETTRDEFVSYAYF